MNLTHDEALSMAEALTEDLWRIGADPCHDVHRIAFKRLTAGGYEREMGGMTKRPLVSFLAARMIEYANAGLDRQDEAQ